LVVVARADDGAVTVAATFSPSDPIGSTAVVITPEPAATSGMLELLDSAIVRLLAYRDGYKAASEKDGPPLLPARWYVW
jgi:hypothetical protein